jgi:hypothetical protein
LIKWSVFLGFCSADRSLSARLCAVVEVERHVYGWELQNRTDTAISLLKCPEVIQQLAVVPQKQAFAVGVKGPLNCASAPPAISPHSSATFAFQLDTAGLVIGPGALTWQLTKGAHADVETTTDMNVTP